LFCVVKKSGPELIEPFREFPEGEMCTKYKHHIVDDRYTSDIVSSKLVKLATPPSVLRAAN